MSELMTAIEMIEKEKGISKEALFDAIEASLLTASKQHFGKSENIKVVIDHDTADYKLYQELEVVADEDFEDPMSQITQEQLKEGFGLEYQIGEKFLKEFVSNDFGRIASQNAKNVILQKIREEERKTVYDKYVAFKQAIISGKVRRKTGRSISVDLGRADAIVPENEQVRTENYIEGSRLKVYITEVENTKRGAKIIASRTHPELVKKLFEAEVAEIQSGVVEMMSIAREAGSRSKLAVWSNDENVDPVGACVGVNGARVNAVTDELFGEKVDIVPWSDNSAEFIENAIAPAKVICVLADDEEREAIVVVPDYQLSLAIGKNGQNARLSAKLTGYKIDIKSETQAREEGLFEEIGYIEDYEYDEEYEEEYEGEEGYEFEEGETFEGYSASPDDEYEEVEEVEEVEETEEV